jgi:hypothetical protein
MQEDIVFLRIIENKKYFKGENVACHHSRRTGLAAIFIFVRYFPVTEILLPSLSLVIVNIILYRTHMTFPRALHVIS